jgi:hypothetical protein
MEKNLKQIKILKNIRNTLLSKFMSREERGKYEN